MCLMKEEKGLWGAGVPEVLSDYYYVYDVYFAAVVARAFSIVNASGPDSGFSIFLTLS
jgi:hypothetical protein